MLAYNQTLDIATRSKLDKLIETAQADGVEKICVGVGIKRGEKVMIARRLPEDFLGGYWELPGGGVDEGEDPLESVIRETREETGLQVTRVSNVFFGFDYRDEKNRLTRQFNFMVEVKETDSVKLTEHDAFEFVGADEVDKFSLTPEMKKSISSFF